jgi:S-adenosylmethionine decarboxylase
MLEITELIVDLYGCHNNLDDEQFLMATLEAAAIKTGSIIIQRTTQKFYPTGISIVLILSETHISLHTWPEYDYAALDIFLCGEGKNPETAWQVVKEAVKPTDFRIHKILRSVKSKSGELKVLRES